MYLGWTVQGREVELHVILQNHYFIIISQVFVRTLKAFYRHFLSKPMLVGVFYRSPENLEFIE